jgi:hypothetical protein
MYTATPKNLRRYHYKVFFPENTCDMCFEFFSQLNDVNVTYHAAHQMFDDPRGIIDLPDKDDLLRPENILVEFYENLADNKQPLGTIQKMLLRIKHFSTEQDFTYLIAREGFIVSAWKSDKTDIHRLTKSLYEYYCPEDLKEQIYTSIR